ncbi:MAG: broad specificity phosphatase PhoE [Ilumatobacter sp.]
MHAPIKPSAWNDPSGGHTEGVRFEHGRPITPNRPELILIRHGETEWSASGQHTGRTDLPLTEQGREEARSIAAAVADIDFTSAFSSPLQRAWETAGLVGLTPTSDDSLLEWDYGDYEGITTAETRETIPGWSVWTHEILNGESIDEVGQRADAAIDRYTKLSGPIAVVAHGHFLRIFAARWLSLPAQEGRRFVLNTSTLSLLGWERENRVIKRWNDPCGW